jgi:hypothetical protein
MTGKLVGKIVTGDVDITPTDKGADWTSLELELSASRAV